MAKPANPQEKIEYRGQLFRDSVRGEKKPDRIPHANDFWTWKVWAAGFKLSEVLYDTPKYTEVMKYMLENYEFDLYADTGSRNPLAMAAILGSDNYILDDERCSINFQDHAYMTADDYDDLLKLGYPKFMYTKVLPRRSSPKLKETPNVGVMYEAAKEWNNFLSMNRTNAAMLTEYGVPAKAGFMTPPAAIEALMSHLRGIKEMSIDLRRRYDKVLATCEELDNTIFKFTEEGYNASRAGKCEGKTPGVAFDMYYSILAHTILNPKKFGDLIWPRFQKVAELAEKHDKTVLLHNEGNSEHLYDFWKDLPENRFAFALEHNDIFRFKKELPHITPMGGMQTSVLSTRTPEQVVDYAKMLVEKLGFDGKFIMSADKMVSYASDCSQENLHALCDFIEEFRYTD